MKHKPEGWVVLTYQSVGDVTRYAIFCSWKGNDIWRVSSGSKALPDLSPCGKYWIWPQKSGSIYELPIDGENGYTFYTGAVLDNLLANGYSDGTKVKSIALNDILNAG